MASTYRDSVSALTVNKRVNENFGRTNLFDSSSERTPIRFTASSSGEFAATARRGRASSRLPKPRMRAGGFVEGSSTYIFRVVYRSRTAIRKNTVNSKDIFVAGPNGFSQFARLIRKRFNRTGTRATAFYRINAPGGTWNVADNGNYSFVLRRRQVSDVGRNFFRNGRLGLRQANFPNPAPTASLGISQFTGSSEYTFTVTYSDDLGINPTTIDANDIRVTGPNGFSQLASLVSVEPNTPTTPLSATYRINAPGGTWDDPDNGNYAIALEPNQVSDLFNSSVPGGTLGNFFVDASKIPPSARLTAANVTSAGNKHTFQVIYEDNEAVIRTSLDNSDIVVTGPKGFSQNATLVSLNPNADGSPLTATYEILAPGGSWDGTEQGTYTVSLAANQVVDNDGNFSPAGNLGTFAIAIPNIVRIEAESLTLSNFRIDNEPEQTPELRALLSGGQMIRVANDNPAQGTATTLFNGATGLYDVVVGYFDENDGESQISVTVGGKLLQQWTLNENTGDSINGSAVVRTPDDYQKTFKLRTLAVRELISNGQAIEVIGTLVDGEPSRIDYIEFIPAV